MVKESPSDNEWLLIVISNLSKDCCDKLLYNGQEVEKESYKVPSSTRKSKIQLNLLKR